MPQITIQEYVNIIFRWIHVISGILWIGSLYFFNFVIIPVKKILDADTQKRMFTELTPRFLFLFRWPAMSAFFAGWILLYLNYMAPGAAGSLDSDRGFWIMMGVLFAFFIWFNTWFIISPSQQKIISNIKAGNPVSLSIPNRSVFFSKVNVCLSIPMVFCMMAAQHFPYAPWYFMLSVVVIGFSLARQLLKITEKVSDND